MCIHTISGGERRCLPTGGRIAGYSSEVPTSLTVVKREPFNAETAPGQLEPDLTPTPYFYVRCHFSLPAEGSVAQRLSVGGSVERPLELSLDELKSLGSRRVIST